MLKKKLRRDFNEGINKKCVYYKNPPDFAKLAEKYHTFKKHLKKVGESYTLNWKSNDAMKELCRVLLLNDFGIKYWNIPDGYLVPPITSRCNYIHWIHDLLERDNLTTTERIYGLDIGTGANCIYPLLGNSIYHWKFKGSDINEKAVEIARNIVQKNNLDEDITISYQSSANDIFYGIIKVGEKYDFTMCNPPYFDEDEIKHNNPNTICEFDEKEVYCKGGEFDFISRMITESESYRTDVKWFTTLVGKKVNLELLYAILKESTIIEEVVKTTFYQGKIARWGLAWKFKNNRCSKKQKSYINSIDY
jgi:23S rRNA A1618 N6-methylase RlmF